MDPIATAALTAALGNLISSATIGLGRLANTSLDHKQVDSGPRILLSDDSVSLVALSHVQTIRDALDDPYLSTLCEAYVFARILASVHGDVNAEALFTDEIADSFRATVRDRLAGTPEAESISVLLWQNCSRSLDELVDAPNLQELLDISELQRLARLDSSALRPGKKQLREPRFLRELARILRSRDSLEVALSVSSEICSGYERHFSEMRLEHATDTGLPEGSNRLTFRSMYIDRSARRDDGTLVETRTILDANRRGRIVVVGDPGVGKSTLLQHTVLHLARSESVRAPILVRVRDIGTDKPIMIEELTAAVRRDLQIHDLSVDALNTLLVLGRATVLFDGLDEANDLTRRRSIAKAIDAFSETYPLASVLVTSRSVGYEKTRLGAGFSKYTLVEFDDAQVMDYVRRWFRHGAPRPEDAEGLYAEMDSIPDLRANPLMLSLICTLYRARGHVPRNRRQVYSQCADLLFNRWDPMRRIDQPTDQIHYGQDLMEEIALWYFKSPSAQSGVEARQLEGIVEHFFRDTAGVLPSAARQRAKSFVEYCSDRAWLLTWIGRDEAGEKLFAFTHRTFMEFFAAESLARSSAEVRVLVRHILSAYQENASSVVPELIVQSAEHARRGQGRDILRDLQNYEATLGSKHRGLYLPLRLRLASAQALPASVTDPLLEEALDGLGEQPRGLTQVFPEILRLPRDPRNRMFAHLSHDLDIPHPIGSDETRLIWAADLVEHWATWATIGSDTTSTHDEWAPQIESLWARIANDVRFRPGVMSRLHFWRMGRWPSTLQADELGLQISLLNGLRVKGKVAWAFDSVTAANDVQFDALGVLKDLPWRLGSECLSERDALAYARLLDSLPEIAPTVAGSTHFRAAFACMSMIASESGLHDADEIAQVVPEGMDFCLLTVAAGRSARGRQRAGLQGSAVAEVRRLGLPDWAELWASGRLSLVRTPEGD